MSAPKKHHFLPVCYLSGFTDEQGKLAIFDRETLTYRSQRPENAGFVRYLYSWILPDGSKDQGLEAHFCKIEGHFPAIRTALEERKLLKQEELDPLIAFIALQIFRVRSTLQNTRDLGNIALDKNLDEVFSDESKARNFVNEFFGENSEEGQLPLEELRQLIEGIYSDDFRSNTTLLVLLKQAMQAYEMLCKKPALTVVHAPAGKKFITTDRPVMVHKADASALGLHGFLGSGSRVYMPISQHIGINLGEGPPSLVHREIDRSDLVNLNSSLAKASSSLLLSDSEQRLSAIIGKTKLLKAPKIPSISIVRQ